MITICNQHQTSVLLNKRGKYKMRWKIGNAKPQEKCKQTRSEFVLWFWAIVKTHSTDFSCNLGLTLLRSRAGYGVNKGSLWLSLVKIECRKICENNMLPTFWHQWPQMIPDWHLTPNTGRGSQADQHVLVLWSCYVTWTNFYLLTLVTPNYRRLTPNPIT